MDPSLNNNNPIIEFNTLMDNIQSQIALINESSLSNACNLAYRFIRKQGELYSWANQERLRLDDHMDESHFVIDDLKITDSLQWEFNFKHELEGASHELFGKCMLIHNFYASESLKYLAQYTKKYEGVTEITNLGNETDNAIKFLEMIPKGISSQPSYKELDELISKVSSLSELQNFPDLLSNITKLKEIAVKLSAGKYSSHDSDTSFDYNKYPLGDLAIDVAVIPLILFDPKTYYSVWEKFDDAYTKLKTYINEYREKELNERFVPASIYVDSDSLASLCGVPSDFEAFYGKKHYDLDYNTAHLMDHTKDDFFTYIKYALNVKPSALGTLGHAMINAYIDNAKEIKEDPSLEDFRKKLNDRLDYLSIDQLPDVLASQDMTKLNETLFSNLGKIMDNIGMDKSYLTETIELYRQFLTYNDIDKRIENWKFMEQNKMQGSILELKYITMLAAKLPLKN
jgi:hypothetical protein